MILYIGNRLTKAGLNPTNADTLGELLDEIVPMILTSSKTNKFLRLLDMSATLLKNRKQLQYVLIDTYSTTNFYYTLLAVCWCRIFKLRYISILHGGNLPNRLDVTPRLCHFVFAHSYRNVAPSQYLEVAFEKRGYTNVEVIPNPFCMSKYSFLPRLSFNPPCLLWVRAYASIYNPTMAIDVLFELKKKYPKACLCMVGPDKDGSKRKVEQQANQYGMTVAFDSDHQADVLLLGKMSQSEWHTLSMSYNIFINTTNFDNTPMSVIEAMALGLPIISTNAGGIPFLVEHTVEGLLSPVEDVPEMVSNIESVVMRPEKALLMTKNARRQVTAFDEAVVLQAWARLLS